MTSWRDVILSKFKNQTDSMIFVKDLDSLLNDEVILNELSNLGYEVVRYEDSVLFYYLYEQQYRQKNVKLLVYVNDDIPFPYKFEQRSLIVSLKIQTLFSKFSAKIMRQIDRSDFDGFYKLQSNVDQVLNEKETLEFLIKRYYKIPYDIIDNEAGLYHVLLQLHLNKQELPEIVEEFLVKKWETLFSLSHLPVGKLVTSTSFFFHHLQEKWTELINELTEKTPLQVREVLSEHPFEHPIVRRMMDDLFDDGYLNKVKGDPSKFPSWMQPGIENEETKVDIKERISNLHEQTMLSLYEVENYKDWIDLIDKLSEYKNEVIKSNKNNIGKFNQLLTDVNSKFENWMMKKYHALTSLAPYPKPKMVHHIPHYLSKVSQGNDKIALLVLDGMNYIQWRFIAEYMENNGFILNETGIFAWVPTLTSVSRQAIFSGKIPLAFSQTIGTTNAEERLWKKFWEEHGVLKQYVTYQKGLGSEIYEKSNIKGLNRNSTRIYGAVVDIIDQFTHNAVLGEKSIYSNLKIWLDSGYLVQLITDLLNHQYNVYITSDHGNTNAEGIGRVNEGVLVDQKGERVRIYSEETLYKHSAEQIPSLKWSNIGLPSNYHVLLSPYGKAFVTKGKKIVTHGGISIEEVIVPFVKVER
ncbi:BREX-3 system phosphatase PglZ [Ureibacillus sp. FSL K6-3587]|uniref:BREX-3 system phosphatase PglZ n=1 Tax=Ureibacillus sp. FSL K6-3587 TaxID=2954681 RepID=UPI00315906E4